MAEAEPDEDAVSVLTVHKAKGLEFPVVFIVGAAEEKFPVKRRGEPLELPRRADARRPWAAATRTCSRSGGSSTWP